LKEQDSEIKNMKFRTSRLTGRIFFWWLILAVALLAVAKAQATTSKTAIVDVLYRADGTPARGTLLISWPAFTTAGGDAIAAGSMTVNLGASGSVQAAVFPNTGSTPQGTYYKVVVDLDDGTRSTEYWVVPQVPQTTIAAVRASLVPQSQALQFVGRDYVDSAIASAVENVLDLTGSQTITGVKTFQSSPQMPTPTNPGDAASRQFVLDTVGNPALAQTTPGTVNATQYQVNGTPLSSSNLSNAASIAMVSQIPTQTSQLTDNSGFITAAEAPVQSVNGMSGAVMLTIPAAQVSSDWSAVSGVTQILHKPALGTAATHAATDFDAAGAAASVAAMISTASATTPAMDSAASTGTASTFARGDHVHPTDTSRQAAMPGVASDSNNGMTVAGNLAACTTLPCPGSGTQISPTAGITTPAVSAAEYKNRSDIVDALADCGLQGAGLSCTNSGTTPYVVNPANCNDDYAAVTACIASYPGRTILFPHTCSTQNCIDYYFSAAIILPHLSTSVLGVTLKGASEHEAQYVHFKFPSGSAGIQGFSYYAIKNLWVQGSDTWDRTKLSTYILPTGFGGSGPAVDGVVLGGRGQASNLLVSDFARHCITGDSTQTGGSDKLRIDHVLAENCRGDGLNMNGADSQIGTITSVSAWQNQLYGVRADSMYGNTWVEVDTQMNHSPNLSSGATTALNGTISSVVCNGSTCIVTMTASNTMYVDDQVILAGTSDSTLNTSGYVTAVNNGSNTFTFGVPTTGQNEALSAGGTATYSTGNRVWSTAGSTARGGGYNVTAGVLIDPYEEGNEPTQWNKFYSSGGSSALVLNPQGVLKYTPGLNYGRVLDSFYGNLVTNELIDTPPGSPTSVSLNRGTTSGGSGYDYYGPVPIAVTNSNPLAYANSGRVQTVYSSLLLRRNFYGPGNNAWNGSNWWCFMLPGYFNTFMGTSSGCAADQLTSTLRSAVTASWWMPNGMFLGAGSYYTPLVYVGVGTAAPTTGNWLKGDIFVNSSPTTGGVWGWRCTAAGTPGTWEAMLQGNPAALADPGSNGIVKRTALNTTTTAAASDVVGLFGSGSCSGYLKNDGTCATPAGTGTLTGTGITATSGPVCANGSLTDLENCGGIPTATGFGFWGVTITRPFGTSSTATSGSGSTANCVPFVLQTPYTISQVTFNLVTGVNGSTSDIGLYVVSGGTGTRVTTLVVNTGGFASAVANQGIQTVALTQGAVTLQQGTYEQCTAGTSGSVIFKAASTSTIADIQGIEDQGSFAISGYGSNAGTGGVLPSSIGNITAEQINPALAYWRR